MSNEGSCPLHPAIRLKRYNRRTGEWKTLLDTCPLCASGLPASGNSNNNNNAGGGGYNSTDRDGGYDRPYEDDEETISSRSSRYSRQSRSVYSAATTITAATNSTFTTGGSDVTYVTDSKSCSSLSTKKRGNVRGNNNYSYGDGGYNDDGGEGRGSSEGYGIYEDDNDRPYTDDEGYRTEDNENNGDSTDNDLDSSVRSGMSRGVRFGPGTKEASEAGTDLESEVDLEEVRNFAEGAGNYDYIRDSLHSNYDSNNEKEEEDLNASYNSNNDLNDYMEQQDIGDSASSQYSNTPPVRNHAPSVLKPSTMGSLVVYDPGRSSNDRERNDRERNDRGHRPPPELQSSLTSLNDEHSVRHQHEKQKYRPPPPPRRDDESLNGMLTQDIPPAADRNTRSASSTRSASRSRNERSVSRSRDSRPAPPQRAPSQPRSSSRARGSSSRGRDSSRSRPREGEGQRSRQEEVQQSNNRPAPPPGRSRSQSRSRQPSRSKGREREDRSLPPQQQPQPPARPVGILKKPLRSSTSSTQLYNPKEAKDDEDFNANDSYNDYDDNATNATRRSNQSRQPGPPPRAAAGMSPPPNNNNNRMRMEPPESSRDEMDNYSLNSRDTARSRPKRGVAPPQDPSERRLNHSAPPQDPRDRRFNAPLPDGPHRRGTDQSGQHPNMNNRVIPQPPRSGPLYIHDDHRENASLNSSDRRGVPNPPHHPPRGMQPPADQSESSSEKQSSRPKHTSKKHNHRRPNDSQTGYTESETNVSDAPSANAEHNEPEIPIMAQASEYDDKGRCVKHPHIKLRKKKMLGGWKVMLVNCPDCCIEEMLKMRRNNRTNNQADKGHRKGTPSEDGSNSSAAAPPISQLTIRNKNDNDDHSSSSGSASEITYGTKTDFSRSSNPGGSWQQSADNSGTSGSGPHRVTRMPFTDAYGHKGWYTGEVASGSGLPHGKGTMHYCDGRMRGGLWSNGLVAAGGGGGLGGNPGRKVGSSGDSVGSHHSSHSRRSRQAQPPPPGGRENVVVGMEWLDFEGRGGFFTGETDEKSRPHGMGSMRYHDGKVLEGEWFHGEFDSRRGDASVKSSRSRSRGPAY